jgi:hypothetical protein
MLPGKRGWPAPAGEAGGTDRNFTSHEHGKLCRFPGLLGRGEGNLGQQAGFGGGLDHGDPPSIFSDRFEKRAQFQDLVMSA